MIEIEPVKENTYASQERMRVQRLAMDAVRTQPDALLARYAALPNTYGGRYVCADSFKELFAEFAKDRDSRNRFNGPVHNSAAVLASAQLANVIRDGRDPKRTEAVFITGIPGAGKSTSVLLNGELPAAARVVYEGQLSDPIAGLKKLNAAREQGLRLKIVVVHTPPERALENTFERFAEYGRGASIQTMAKIQGNLPEALEAIRQALGRPNPSPDQVTLTIVDRSADFVRPTILRGWQHLPYLSKEGDHDHIKERLQNALESARTRGRIDEPCYRQAAGLEPREQRLDLNQQRTQGHGTHGRGRDVSR